MTVPRCALDDCVLEPGHDYECIQWSGFKYATPRNTGARTDGGRVAKIAAGIGKPGMPWQRQVWDTALERGAFGELIYEIVFVTVPRQSGKTTLYGPVQLDRCITMPAIKTFYTAQTGKDARSRFGDLVSLVQDSPLDSMLRYRYSAGDEGILFPNGSALKLFAPVVAALHGETPPLVGMDEIWELDEALGDAILEGAIIPAQVTLAGQRQIWLLSTAGDARSTFMRKWVERGRESVLKPGTNQRLAYFEAALPDGADPYDRRAIAAFHPAVGHTMSLDALMEISGQVSRATWLRAFCNVWLEASDPLFSSEEVTANTRDPDSIPNLSHVAITYEIAPDNELGGVFATWRDLDDAPVTRVLHVAPGSMWMHDYIVDLVHKHAPIVVGGDDGGATRRLTDQLRRTLGDEAITTVGARDFGTSCEGWVTMFRDRQLKLDGSRTMTLGLAHLVLKRVGDLTRFSRSESTGPIIFPIGSAVGIWLYDHREAPAETARVY